MQKNGYLPPITGVIFDLDGTLVQSSLDFQALRKKVSCPSEQDILSFVDSLDESSRLAAEQVIKDAEMLDAQDAKRIDGVAELLAHIEKNHLPSAIVTRNIRRAAELKCQQNNIGITFLLTREDAPAKPAPDALLQIAQSWQHDVSSLLYVGDYKYDVEAANRAGMISCLYVPKGDPIPNYAAEADILVQDMKDIIAFLT